MLSASSTFASFVKLVPESIECQSPYVLSHSAPPASQMSPSRPGTALNLTGPPRGRPAARSVLHVRLRSVFDMLSSCRDSRDGRPLEGVGLYRSVETDARR